MDPQTLGTHYHHLHHSPPAILGASATTGTRTCLTSKQGFIGWRANSSGPKGGRPAPPLSQSACCCTAYKWPPSWLLSASSTTTNQPLSLKFQISISSLVVHLVEVLLKLGKDKSIQGRSSAEILLRENYRQSE